MNSICGVQFVRNGIQYDYCFEESIQSMLECCDFVVVVDAGSTDETLEKLYAIDNPLLKIISLPNSEWDGQQGTGKSKLCYFTNIAIQEADRLGFSYVLSVQSDEVIHEISYAAIRNAVQDNDEGYLIRRVNLWKSPYLQLSVPKNRLPCSDYVLRLAKVNYRAYGDAESLNAPANEDYTKSIRMYHMGFVRKKEVMRDKIINMQCGVFEMENYDPKLDKAELFNPDFWFNPEEDLIPISEPLPKVIEKWAFERR